MESGMTAGMFSLTKGVMGTARAKHCALQLDRRAGHPALVLIAGGFTLDPGTNSYTILASTVRYAQSVDAFEVTGDMKEPRQNCAAVPVAREDQTTDFFDALVIGGGSVERYDTVLWHFTSQQALDRYRSAASSALAYNGPNGQFTGLLIVGGDGDAGKTAQMISFGVHTSYVLRLKIPRVLHSVTALPNGHVLIAGGLGASGVAAEVFNSQSGRFTRVGDLTVPRARHAACLVSTPKGAQVLITGGEEVNAHGVGGPAHATAELFDPATGTFTPTGRMSVSRTNHTATASGDLQRVLVVGGIGPDDMLASSEIYDGNTGQFSPSGSMSVPRSDHTATLLNGPHVLVAGGQNSNGVLGSAEVYTFEA
jgi:Galactose oxidase, central domain